MLKFYNTLTKKKEQFKPLNGKKVLLYACGPTVYDYAHIGNFRTYVLTDVLVRALKYFGYRVRFVMNITDVGHLTSDSDTGEDKMEKGAKREGKSAWDIAKFYTDVFLSDSKKLNLLEPDVRPRPTQEKYIKAQIEMVRELERKGNTYKTSDGIYFDTSKFPSYGKLTSQDRKEFKEGARIKVNKEKRNPTDFALWKSSPGVRPLENPSFDNDPNCYKVLSQIDREGKSRSDPKVRRQMEWNSPWGVGFPGWHIECSAMSRVELGDQIDIHTGGVDLIPIHHTNEIAQSEASTGKSPFSKFWVHGQFLLVDGKKMSKKKGNFYNLSDIEKKDFDPLALRYFYLTAHYRQFLNFTWDSIKSAQKSLESLCSQISNLKFPISKRRSLSEEKLEKVDALRQKFESALQNDLNMPKALSVAWETLKSNIPSTDKLDLLYSFDEVLGLDLQVSSEQQSDIPTSIQKLVSAREQLRKSGNFEQADQIRKEIEKSGFAVKDTPSGSVLQKS